MVLSVSAWSSRHLYCFTTFLNRTLIDVFKVYCSKPGHSGSGLAQEHWARGRSTSWIGYQFITWHHAQTQSHTHSHLQVIYHSQSTYWHIVRRKYSGHRKSMHVLLRSSPSTVSDHDRTWELAAVRQFNDIILLMNCVLKKHYRAFIWQASS